MIDYKYLTKKINELKLFKSIDIGTLTDIEIIEFEKMCKNEGLKFNIELTTSKWRLN